MFGLKSGHKKMDVVDWMFFDPAATKASVITHLKANTQPSASLSHDSNDVVCNAKGQPRH